jgi:hypothetical protein
VVSDGVICVWWLSMVMCGDGGMVGMVEGVDIIIEMAYIK